MDGNLVLLSKDPQYERILLEWDGAEFKTEEDEDIIKTFEKNRCYELNKASQKTYKRLEC